MRAMYEIDTCIGGKDKTYRISFDNRIKPDPIPEELKTMFNNGSDTNNDD